MSVWALFLSMGAVVAAGMPPELIDPAQWISVDDYPSEAMLNGWEGTTGFRLSVDATGAVTDCAVTLPSGHPLLDEVTCNLMRQRSHFRPATDARGEPVAAALDKKMEWQIPGDPSMSWAVVRFTGSGPECVVDKESRMEAEPCRSLADAIQRAGLTLPARVQIGKRAAEPH